MRNAWIAIVLVVGGCLTQSPVVPARYQLSVPMACAVTASGDYINEQGAVLIGDSARGKQAADGNTYTLRWFAAHSVPELATNIWPVFRMHMDLSIDGGSNWIRRIGYGLQTPKGQVDGEFVWSPPNDYRLLTINAVLRLVDLDGRPFRGDTSLPSTPGTNGVWSPTFAILGSVVDAPAAGATLYPDTPINIIWRQVGGGDNANLYWVTPSTNGFLATFDNVVNGTNNRAIWLPVDLPVAEQMRFCIRGVEYPSIIGYSGTFQVIP